MSIEKVLNILIKNGISFVYTIYEPFESQNLFYLEHKLFKVR